MSSADVIAENKGKKLRMTIEIDKYDAVLKGDTVEITVAATAAAAAPAVAERKDVVLDQTMSPFHDEKKGDENVAQPKNVNENVAEEKKGTGTIAQEKSGGRGKRTRRNKQRRARRSRKNIF